MKTNGVKTKGKKATRGVERSITATEVDAVESLRPDYGGGSVNQIDEGFRHHSRRDAGHVAARNLRGQGRRTVARLAFECVHDAVYLVSDSLHIIDVNRSAQELSGCQFAEIAGLPLGELLDPGPGADLHSRMQIGAEDERVARFPAMLATCDDERVPVDLAVSARSAAGAAVDPDGWRDVAYVVSLRDLRSATDFQPTAEGLSAVFDANSSPVLRVSRTGRILYANPASWILLEHWGVGVDSLLPAEWRDKVMRVFKLGESVEIEVPIGFKVIQLVGVPIPEMGYISLYGLDVTGRKRTEEKLALSAQVVENASEGVLIADPDFRVLEVNKAFTTITGLTPGDILGESAVPLLSGERGESTFRDLWNRVKKTGSWQGELWDRRKNGEAYPKWLSISAVKDASGVTANYTIIFADISKVKEAEEHLYRLAHYDSLTGLANRRFFRDRLEEQIVRTKRVGGMAGLIFVDLDGFKAVNDNLGHQAGDELLALVADRLQASVRESDTIARIGGDEFTVILPDLREPKDVAPVAEKILSAIRRPMTIDSQELAISASVGVALYPDDGTDADSLLRFADTAMYQIKQSGKNNYRYFSPEMNTRAARRLSIRTRLKRALDSGEIGVHYQPQVDPASGRIAAVEALARWHSAETGTIGPTDFIPIAEDCGLIHELADSVFRSVCAQWHEWNDAGINVPRLTVNVSAPQLRSPDFPRHYLRILGELGVPAAAIEFELTESMFIDDPEAAIRKLHELRSTGASLAIDDFGTKYSSLAYLKRLPVDRVKIDWTFVKDLPNDENSAKLACAVVAMASSMGLEVVAEGIERRAQLEFLRDEGCHLVQGNLVCPATSGEAVEPFLRASRIELGA